MSTKTMLLKSFLRLLAYDCVQGIINLVRVERFVTSPLPHRPGRADFPHPVPQVMDSLHKQNDRFLAWLKKKYTVSAC